MKIHNDQIYKTLQTKFGFSEFKSGQLEIIQRLCNRKNVLAVLPTGTGKSLIYQLFGYLINRPIIVISPLISLIDDQVARLNRLGEKRVIGLTSKLDHNQRQFALKHLRNYRFIYVSPEMADQPDVRLELDQINCGLFVIDEAHCLSQWGPDFRPAYLKLKDLVRHIGSPTTLMLTATAKPAVRKDIIEKMGFAVSDVIQVVHSVDRPNIFLDVEHCASLTEKNEKLLDLISVLKGSGIIYFSSKKIANQISELIAQKTGRTTAAYHADIDLQDRYRIQQQFMHGNIELICATSAFGMGIDKDNVRFVIHYHMPGNLENYLQEIGRAGRDQRASIAILLYAPGDEYIPSTLNLMGLPSAANIQTFFHQPESRASFDDDQRQLLTYYHDQRKTSEDVTQIFQTRQLAKQTSLVSMLDYINETDCLRTKLLAYFDEQFNEHSQNCCATDQALEKIKQLHLDTVPNKQDVSDVKKQLVPWQMRLEQLFSSKK
ncbi:ATP-dependent DNA helicase RecQ [Pediococcus damnosus]|uniref:ATP-dependent DNA helicase RecQ n=1 Tax=Pediococcus damnosus TaxID=51663 RepID=A0A0R2HLI4_9LACO|nr:RecQ family ATP-dependent DNA helicase [Pediococcus damnosus]AMV61560.1 ATP-dependent DNA helicase RecQ [Pediococcus damnosus]AMV62076.1 ATP-dependent DNA helicase RecQ [Pediococcus damnosus]AMV65922.1 ATP-dependent DNA helicase RecQ [Pediococcus damnosus]AMV68073.1 ATP-dependent DNA helicase RecQ [Pediococcus damnosus]AMV70258.1 ATP-dependent DNA helicase RecQ [Pediococcus damnosus]